jgi:hypothetical protein
MYYMTLVTPIMMLADEMMKIVISHNLTTVSP